MPDRALPLDHLARLFTPTETVWERHANPWSVWTRVALLPALMLAIWSRAWIGWWAALPIAALILWAWLNPRAFPPPRHTRSWAARAVLGERVLLNHRAVPVPRHHLRATRVLALTSVAGLPLLAWGLAAFRIWPALLGAVLILGGKLWFCDRMVWLFEDMALRHARYAAWRR